MRFRLCLFVTLFTCATAFGQGSKKFRDFPNPMLTYEQAESLAIAHGFFDATWNADAKGFRNQFEVKDLAGGKVVIDNASGLMWQHGGSATTLTLAEGHSYVDTLNRTRYLGFSDWRMPTLEEAMTLLENQKFKNNLYISELFDGTQPWIWTCDMHGSELAWVVLFDFSAAYEYTIDVAEYVRAVRTIQK